MVITSTTAIVHLALAQTTYDITKAEGGKAYGGEKIGELTVTPANNTVGFSAKLNNAPPEGKVYEAWLVDEGGSGDKLSLGKIEQNTLNFQQDMVNPYTYKQFIITEEPKDDPDPKASSAIAGVELTTPFGQ